MNYCRWLDCTTLIFPIFCGLIGSWCEWKAAQNKSVSERTTSTRKGEKETSVHFRILHMWLWESRQLLQRPTQNDTSLSGWYTCWTENSLFKRVIKLGTNSNLLSLWSIFFPLLRVSAQHHVQCRYTAHAKLAKEGMTDFIIKRPRKMKLYRQKLSTLMYSSPIQVSS